MSLDGFFTDAKGDMSWAHKQDPEWQAFVKENASGGGQLLFGRKTYELMAGFWSTPSCVAEQSCRRRAAQCLAEIRMLDDADAGDLEQHHAVEGRSRPRKSAS